MAVCPGLFATDPKQARIVLHSAVFLDKDRRIFKSRNRGVFTYDPETDTCGSFPDNFIVPESRRSRKEKLILDFADARIVSRFIQTIGLIPAIEALGYGNNGSVYVMILFYILADLSWLIYPG